MKLNELGHPQYLTEGSLPRVLCSEQKEEVYSKVLRMQDIVEEWRQEVSELRARYTWLLYFSVSKILLFHKQIMMKSSPDVDALVHEVSFIVYNQKIERTQLRQGVMVSFEIPQLYCL
jgi:hypothetical protein